MDNILQNMALILTKETNNAYNTACLFQGDGKQAGRRRRISLGEIT
jgi:hypothetical protein